MQELHGEQGMVADVRAHVAKDRAGAKVLADDLQLLGLIKLAKDVIALDGILWVGDREADGLAVDLVAHDLTGGRDEIGWGQVWVCGDGLRTGHEKHTLWTGQRLELLFE